MAPPRCPGDTYHERHGAAAPRAQRLSACQPPRPGEAGPWRRDGARGAVRDVAPPPGPPTAAPRASRPASRPRCGAGRPWQLTARPGNSGRPAGLPTGQAARRFPHPLLLLCLREVPSVYKQGSGMIAKKWCKRRKLDPEQRVLMLLSVENKRKTGKGYHTIHIHPWFSRRV